MGVKPEQFTLGYSFHRRSFKLSNPSCTTPGCPFKGGARAGPCSDTSGILMYYEISAILKQLPNLKPVFDKKAAVKYLSLTRTSGSRTTTPTPSSSSASGPTRSASAAVLSGPSIRMTTTSRL